MLSTILDVFRLRQYFNGILAARDVVDGLREDAGFLNTVRRTLISLPMEQVGPSDVRPFPPPVERRLPGIEGKRVALVATGGSGALASVTGVWRAFEESGIAPSVVSVCSGSSLFGFPLAAGFSADEVAEFTLGMRGEDFVDINWRDLRRAALSAGRGFAGFIRGEKLEETYRRLVGDMTLAEMPIPCYAPIWNIEQNRLEYIGPRTHPHLSVARAIHVAIALPLFLDPVEIGGGSWCDGGIVDIFPVHPVLDIEPPSDVALAVNGFYPPEFAGESADGWRERAGSIFHVASQVRTCQQIELARENLARLREAIPVLMTDPVPYEVVKGVGFYKQFMDRSDWPEFMRAGHRDALAALASFAKPRARSRPAAKRVSRPRRSAAHHARRRQTAV
jgi:NTE family protein